MNRRQLLRRIAALLVAVAMKAVDLEPAFDDTSRVMLADKSLIITGCEISKNKRGFWAVHCTTATFGIGTTFPKGTTEQQVKEWAKKFEKCIGQPVRIK